MISISTSQGTRDRGGGGSVLQLAVEGRPGSGSEPSEGTTSSSSVLLYFLSDFSDSLDSDSATELSPLDFLKIFGIFGLDNFALILFIAKQSDLLFPSF